MVSISEALQAKLADRVASCLSSHRNAGHDLRATAASLRLRTRAAERARADARARLLPFTPDTTVHQAWARHPAAARGHWRARIGANECEWATRVANRILHIKESAQPTGVAFCGHPTCLTCYVLSSQGSLQCMSDSPPLVPALIR